MKNIEFVNMSILLVLVNTCTCMYTIIKTRLISAWHFINTHKGISNSHKDKVSEYSVSSSHNKIQTCTVCPFCITLDQKQIDSD